MIYFYLLIFFLGFNNLSALALNQKSLSIKSRAILQKKCADCHSAGTPLPLYAKLPFVQDLIKKDIEEGLVEFDMKRDLYNIPDKNLDEGVLLKLLTSTTDKTMPPIQYSIIHWDKVLTKEERKILLDWLNSFE